MTRHHASSQGATDLVDPADGDPVEQIRELTGDFPRYVALAETGRLDLGSMITRRITLDDVNDAVHAMETGEVIRSVIV